jgi:hypothetical protein
MPIINSSKGIADMENDGEVSKMDAVQTFQLSEGVFLLVDQYCREHGIIKSSLYRQLQNYHINMNSNLIQPLNQNL